MAMIDAVRLSVATAGAVSTSLGCKLNTGKRSSLAGKATAQWNLGSSFPVLRTKALPRLHRLTVKAAGESVEVGVKEAGQKGDILPSGEWPENFSLLNFEDLTRHYEPSIFKPEVDQFFVNISGIPVIDKELKCVGVLSKKDLKKAADWHNATVQDVMNSPPITLSAEKTVSDAAVLMLKNKIHRIPIVNEFNQVVGIVTRTDIFTALEEGV